jgi:hypothetical protein
MVEELPIACDYIYNFGGGGLQPSLSLFSVSLFLFHPFHLAFNREEKKSFFSGGGGGCLKLLFTLLSLFLLPCYTFLCIAI